MAGVGYASELVFFSMGGMRNSVPYSGTQKYVFACKGSQWPDLMGSSPIKCIFCPRLNNNSPDSYAD